MLQKLTINALRLRLLLFAGLCISAFAGTVLADGERPFPNANFAVTPPAGWEDVTSKIDVKNLVVAYRDPDQSRIVMVLSSDSPETVAEINDKSVDELEAPLAAGGSKRISGKFTSFLGIKCYERVGTSPGGLSTWMKAVPVYGRFYFIEGLRSSGGAAQDDAEIRRFIESFHFLKTPHLVR